MNEGLIIIKTKLFRPQRMKSCNTTYPQIGQQVRVVGALEVLIRRTAIELVNWLS